MLILRETIKGELAKLKKGQSIDLPTHNDISYMAIANELGIKISGDKINGRTVRLWRVK